MPTYSGYWKLDAIDLSEFKTVILDGTADFLKYAPKKDSIEYNWPDQHGLDVDLSTPKFASRDIKLLCAIFTDDRADFFDNYYALINQLMLPGFHNLTVIAHDKTYSVEYKSCSEWKKIDPLTPDDTTPPAYTFTLILREPEPNPSPGIRVFDDSGDPVTT